jgi:hypothetical protein
VARPRMCVCIHVACIHVAAIPRGHTWRHCELVDVGRVGLLVTVQAQGELMQAALPETWDRRVLHSLRLEAS